MDVVLAREEPTINSAPLDPRSVCNLILDEAGGRFPITHVPLQKLLYFAHGLHLVRTRRPLVSGYFEAWQRGPVHPAAYAAFKKAGSGPIQFRAVRQNPLTGETSPLPPPCDPVAVECVSNVVRNLAHHSPWYLEELSHAKGAPWDIVVNKARNCMAFGMRIPDTVIFESFRLHKVALDGSSRIRDEGEDSPFA